jgi:predicted phage tail protein
VYQGTTAGGEDPTPVNAAPLAADASSFDVTGLTNGTTYFFVVKAVNAIAEGAASNEASATPSATATVPGAPTALTATAGDSTATLNWTAPISDGGSAITGYNVYEGTSAGGEGTTPVNAAPLAADASSFDVPGLTNGTTYFFTVKAINAIGEGAPSNEASATPTGAATAPDAPVALTATPGDSSATLNWSPPTSDGGSAITGYNVYESTSPGGEGTTPINASPLPADTTTFPVTGLTNGTTYYFTVTAINAIGEGAASNEASATPSALAGPPGQPVGLSAAPGDGSAMLTWSAPVVDGGSPITGYNVYLGTTAGGESTTPLNATPLAADASSFDATGLTNGTTYYFVVTAINAFGEGNASNEATATPGTSATVPDAPTSLTCTPGNTTVTLNWSPPASDGGSPITGYNVYMGTTPGGESTTPVNASPLPATAVSFPVQGLTNGTTYYITVTAINAIGEGAASSESSATPTASATAPDAPIALSATPGDGLVALSWSAPASDGGSAITGYNVYVGTSPGGESTTPVNASPLSGTASSFDVTGLTNGTTYYFTVTAINGISESAPSNEASATPDRSAMTPGAPINLEAEAVKLRVTLTWTAPVLGHRSAITGYDVYVGTIPGGESATPANASPLSPNARRYTLTGLESGTTYYFTVKAINAAGPGDPSNEAAATPSSTATTPGTPSRVTAAAGRTRVTLTWTAPRCDGASAITGYNVYVGTTRGGESDTPVNAVPISAHARHYTVTGLEPGTKYYFRVRAINALGVGPVSHEVAATTTGASASAAWLAGSGGRMY